MVQNKCSDEINLGCTEPVWAMGQPIPRAMTYSAESGQIIRLEYGQTVAVKKLSKIEKTAIKLSKLVN
jgi:hypothetical protein